ncbi:FadR/GntR family transcriptional regulator [Streptomyces poriferorum]|uniref:FadR/GntR family transcriptional regulator n=1 Tax=Streptomyces poriferorum TaxID=2798799 RepID=A0ABY9IMQ5_9ACTN|nr:MULTISPECIES: FadR/GntR family transcriptional regulator [Streptomyces]WSQ42924.1 FadR family transcriptional regulator [Streptomyces sp. NBC_01220]MBW5247595.1 FadR family transcriptional regulator [Streptomyces poriferorum]MBW5255260.1 FadR family transcriptional regulator [Streptomyces poriferorum]MDP5317186.1 FadR/GntR family transcriptional regulator [Streptomyces sp. Alt4]WLQ51794.1 FadR/GntR family transcriptional regulator [Streptomyces sp. Alt1]
MARPTMAQDIERRIKELILDRRLAPGDALPTESELMDLFEAGRVSVREALKSLQAVNVVEIRRGYGTFVGSLSLSPFAEGLAFRAAVRHRQGEPGLAELMKVREALEAGLVGTVAAGVPAEDLDVLRALVAKMEEEAGAGRVARSTDRAFHLALYASLDNHLLSEVLDAFWAAMDRVREDFDDGHQDPSVTCAQHREIVEAVAAADGLRAVRAMRTHFDGIRTRLETSPVR